MAESSLNACEAINEEGGNMQFIHHIPLCIKRFDFIALRSFLSPHFVTGCGSNWISFQVFFFLSFHIQPAFFFFPLTKKKVKGEEYKKEDKGEMQLERFCLFFEEIFN